MFNWLAVIVLLIVEVVTRYLEKVSAAIVEVIHLDPEVDNPDILKAITKPLTKAVIQLDKKVLKGWAHGEEKYDNVTTILKISCKDHNCTYLFSNLGPQGADIGDTGIGIILLIISLVLLSFCLIMLVKLLN